MRDWQLAGKANASSLHLALRRPLGVQRSYSDLVSGNSVPDAQVRNGAIKNAVVPVALANVVSGAGGGGRLQPRRVRTNQASVDVNFHGCPQIGPSSPPHSRESLLSTSMSDQIKRGWCVAVLLPD